MSDHMAVVGRGREVMSRYSALLLAVLCATAASGVVSTAAAQARTSDAGSWEIPRTPDRNLSTTMGHSTGLIREQCPVW